MEAIWIRFKRVWYGVLDSARYACFIREALQCSIKDVRAMVLGGHGDTMVPVPQFSLLMGLRLQSYYLGSN